MKRLSMAVFILLPMVGASLAGRDTSARLMLSAGLDTPSAWLAQDLNLKGRAHYAAGNWEEAAEMFGRAGPDASYNLGNALAKAGRFNEAIKAYNTALEYDPNDQDAIFNRALVTKLLEGMQLAGAPVTPAGTANAGASEERSNEFEPDAEGGDSTGIGNGKSGGIESKSDAEAPGGSKVSQTGSGERQAKEKGDSKGRGSAGDAEGAGRTGAVQVDVAKMMQQRERRYGRMWTGQSILPTRQWLDTIPDDPGRYLKLRLAAEKARRQATALNAGGAK
jgi:Ca-activated chloride channel family protein